MKGPDGMNIKERIVLWLSVVIIVIITIYPPTHRTESYKSPSGIPIYHQVVEYKSLFKEPVGQIYWNRLLFQYVVVFIITSGIMALLAFIRRETNERLRGKISELAAVHKKFRHKISELNRSNVSLKKQRDKLEQHMKQQGCKLAATNEQLEQQIAERKESEEKLKEYHEQLKGQVEQLTAELVTARERGQQQVAEHRESEEMTREETEEASGVTCPSRPLDEGKLRSLAEMVKRLSKRN